MEKPLTSVRRDSMDLAGLLEEHGDHLLRLCTLYLGRPEPSGGRGAGHLPSCAEGLAGVLRRLCRGDVAGAYRYQCV